MNTHETLFRRLFLAAFILLSAARQAGSSSNGRTQRYTSLWLRQAGQDAASLVEPGSVRAAHTDLPDRAACTRRLVQQSQWALLQHAARALHDTRRDLFRERVRNRVRAHLRAVPTPEKARVRLKPASEAGAGGDTADALAARDARAVTDPVATDTKPELSVTATEETTAARTTRLTAEGDLTRPRTIIDTQDASDRNTGLTPNTGSRRDNTDVRPRNTEPTVRPGTDGTGTYDTDSAPGGNVDRRKLP